MKVLRSYALPNKGININRIIEQLIEIEIAKLVNSRNVNSPASHENINPGGDYA